MSAGKILIALSIAIIMAIMFAHFCSCSNASETAITARGGAGGTPDSPQGKPGEVVIHYVPNGTNISVMGSGGVSGGGSASMPSYTVRMPDDSTISIATGDYRDVEPYLRAGGRIIGGSVIAMEKHGKNARPDSTYSYKAGKDDTVTVHCVDNACTETHSDGVQCCHGGTSVSPPNIGGGGAR